MHVEDNKILAKAILQPSGSLTKSVIIKKKLNKPDNIFVVSNPLINKTRTKTILNKTRTLLFLDIPIKTWPTGVFDFEGFHKFRIELLKKVQSCGYNLIYKLHPFTTSAEVNLINNLIIKYSNTSLQTDGTAQDYFHCIDACLTFPSTAIFEVLSAGVPLVQICLQTKGFGGVFWDPVKKYNAGFTITSANELEEILNKINDLNWNKVYLTSSKIAAEEMIGPLTAKHLSDLRKQ